MKEFISILLDKIEEEGYNFEVFSHLMYKENRRRNPLKFKTTKQLIKSENLGYEYPDYPYDTTSGLIDKKFVKIPKHYENIWYKEDCFLYSNKLYNNKYFAVYLAGYDVVCVGWDHMKKEAIHPYPETVFRSTNSMRIRLKKDGLI